MYPLQPVPDKPLSFVSPSRTISLTRLRPVRNIFSTGPCMRVIVTGGTGLIGRALVRSLSEAGEEVIVLSRKEGRATSEGDVQVCRWDARSGDTWASLIDNDTAIVNLAGENVGSGRWTKRRKDRIFSSRINAALAVRDAVERADRKPVVVLQGSAVGYYGACGDKAVIESHPAGNDFLARVCVETEAASASIESLGVRWMALRTGVVLSMSGGALPRMSLPVRLGLGGRLGGGRQWFPWIHIEDEVSAIRFLLANQSARGAFNLCSFDPMRNRHFTKVLARVLRRPALFPVPSPALRLLLGEMAAMLLTGQRAVPRRLLEMGFRFKHPEAGAALHDLFGVQDPKP